VGALPFEEQVFLVFKFVFLDFSLGEEGNGKLTPVEMEAALYEVDAALVTLQVVQTKK